MASELNDLTEEHRKILAEVALGHTDATIARHCLLSESTVRRRLRDVADVLGVRGRVALVAAALKYGLMNERPIDRLIR